MLKLLSFKVCTSQVFNKKNVTCSYKKIQSRIMMSTFMIFFTQEKFKYFYQLTKTNLTILKQNILKCFFGVKSDKTHLNECISFWRGRSISPSSRQLCHRIQIQNPRETNAHRMRLKWYFLQHLTSDQRWRIYQNNRPDVFSVSCHFSESEEICSH